MKGSREQLRGGRFTFFFSFLLHFSKFAKTWPNISEFQSLTFRRPTKFMKCTNVDRRIYIAKSLVGKKHINERKPQSEKTKELEERKKGGGVTHKYLRVDRQTNTRTRTRYPLSQSRCRITWPTLSQLHSFKIHHANFLNYIKFADYLIK